MKFYRDIKAEMPCMEYMVKTDIATHFFCDPNVENDDIITEFTYLGEYEIPDDANYVEISERLVPESILNSINNKENKARDKIKQNKIEETYQIMLQREKVKEEMKRGRK
jgi:hypothetical protein